MADIKKIQIGNTEYDIKDVVSGYTTNKGTVTSVNGNTPNASGEVTVSVPSELGDLSNVTISSPSAGQNLTYDATNQVWKNTSTSATVAWGGITGTLSDQTDLANALGDKYDASNPDGFISGITSTDVTTALGFTPYDSSNPNGYTSNTGTVTSVNNISPTNGNVSLTIPTVNVDDVQINGTSILSSKVANIVTNTAYNASSNKIATMSDIPSLSGYLQNTATGTDALTLIGNATNKSGSINIGKKSYATGNYSCAIGYEAEATNTNTIAIGQDAKATASNAIQIGYGTNSTADSFNVGIGLSNYKLLDGTTGLIPDARISNNIARTSDLFSRNIGEIVQSTIPLTDAGLHLLDGSLLTYGSYSAFIDYIADLYDSGDYTDIFDTEANWQTAVTTYGVCGKFVYDSVNNTVRLPKITGFTEGTIDPTTLGDLTEAGLPNITGSFVSAQNGSTPPTEAFSVTVLPAGFGGNTNNSGRTVTFNAANSNAIYGNSSTVQPQTIKILYYIVVATSTKTEIEVDIDQIATDLNGKMDVDMSNMNASQSAKNTIMAWGMPDYTAGVSRVVSTVYTADYDCLAYIWVAGSSTTDVQRAAVEILDNNEQRLYVFQNCAIGASGKNVSAYASAFIPKGTKYKFTVSGGNGSQNIYIFPLKGVN